MVSFPPLHVGCPLGFAPEAALEHMCQHRPRGLKTLMGVAAGASVTERGFDMGGTWAHLDQRGQRSLWL